MQARDRGESKGFRGLIPNGAFNSFLSPELDSDRDIRVNQLPRIDVSLMERHGKLELDILGECFQFTESIGGHLEEDLPSTWVMLKSTGSKHSWKHSIRQSVASILDRSLVRRWLLLVVVVVSEVLQGVGEWPGSHCCATAAPPQVNVSHLGAPPLEGTLRVQTLVTKLKVSNCVVVLH